MPLYEYECEACGHRFERIQKYSDPPAEVCPKCGKKQLRKLVSSPAIQFKGSGFYINDYARKGAPGADGADTDGSKAPPPAKGDDKSADKPAAAPSTSTASSSSGSKESSSGSKESSSGSKDSSARSRESSSGSGSKQSSSSSKE